MHTSPCSCFALAASAHLLLARSRALFFPFWPFFLCFLSPLWACSVAAEQLLKRQERSKKGYGGRHTSSVDGSGGDGPALVVNDHRSAAHPQHQTFLAAQSAAQQDQQLPQHPQQHQGVAGVPGGSLSTVGSLDRYHQQQWQHQSLGLHGVAVSGDSRHGGGGGSGGYGAGAEEEEDKAERVALAVSGVGGHCLTALLDALLSMTCLYFPSTAFPQNARTQATWLLRSACERFRGVGAQHRFRRLLALLLTIDAAAMGGGGGGDGGMDEEAPAVSVTVSTSAFSSAKATATTDVAVPADTDVTKENAQQQQQQVRPRTSPSQQRPALAAAAQARVRAEAVQAIRSELRGAQESR